MCNSIPYKLNLRNSSLVVYTIYIWENFTRMTFNCVFEAFIVISWKVQNVFDLENMSVISSCAPGVMIEGVEVLFLSPVGYVSLQSLSPGVESCRSCCSFAQMLRMLQVCTCPPLLCHLHPSSYSFPDF